MDFAEKAAVRIEHWIAHNDHHREDYAAFAEQLDAAGRQEAAGYIREMMALDRQATDLLRRALAALETSRMR